MGGGPCAHSGRNALFQSQNPGRCPGLISSAPLARQSVLSRLFQQTAFSANPLRRGFGRRTMRKQKPELENSTGSEVRMTENRRRLDFRAAVALPLLFFLRRFRPRVCTLNRLKTISNGPPMEPTWPARATGLSTRLTPRISINCKSHGHLRPTILGPAGNTISKELR